jgi:membrane-bound lytic murein transglycosylase F
MSRLRDRSAALLLLLALPGCGGGGPGPGDDATYVELGDLSALRERGELRIVLPPTQARLLPRVGDTLDRDIRLARELAAELGLVAKMEAVEDRSELLSRVLEGRADVAIARLTASDERRRRFGFSVPLDHVRELLVVRVDDESIRGFEDLDGRKVAVRASSAFHETLRALQEEVPGLRIQLVDERWDTEEILQRVAWGELEAAVADEDLLTQVLRYEPELKAALTLTGERPIAWALRPDAVELKAAIDGFLQRQALTRHHEERMTGDLDAIRERRVLRVLTRNNAATYFLHRGRQVGFEFELARRFAGSIGCRLQVVVPPQADQLIPWLLEGRGDVVAAALSVTPERSAWVAFSRPYNHVSELLVTRAGEVLLDPSALAGRAVTVRASSAYHDTLLALRQRVDFELLPAPEDMETEELIAAVGRGEIDLTVADSNILDIELTYRDDVEAAFALGETKAIAWAVRPDNVDLLAEIDGFIDREYRGEFYNVIHGRYFENTKKIARLVSDRAARGGRISPYDDLFRKYGREIEVDWRLLAAQAYTESQFDPDAQSWAGALGLMQVLPRTAREMGVTGNLHDPEVGVRAGALYLRHLIDRFEPTLPFEVRLRFALAAYNAGRGHIVDGRRLAREQGLDPDLWFGNVERVLPLLGRRAYAAKARYGYCRCRQPVEYVRQIDQRYAAYSRVVESFAGAP